MDKFLKIIPLDPLFFRSPMPFNAGEQDWAFSYPLPLPGTLYGAIRSMILSRRNYDRFAEGNGYKDIGTPDAKGTLKLKTYAIGYEDDSGVNLYFPVPFNILGKYKNEKLIEVKKAFPMKLKEIIISPEGEINEFFYLKEDDYEPIGGRLLSFEGLKKYLKGEDVDVGDFIERKQLFVEEPKVGIAREREIRTAQERKFYRVKHFRYKKNVSIISWIDGTEERLNGLFTLGGERRVAEVKEIEDPFGFDELEVKVDGYRFLVYLATPAIFENGCMPRRVIDELKEMGVELEPITAMITEYKVISGWDIQKRAPKTLYRAIPEGSIFVFEVIKGNIQKAIEVFHRNNISDINPDEGYGFALVGKI